MTATMVEQLNSVFRDASERFEKANAEAAELAEQLGTKKRDIAYRKGLFEDMEASWIFGEELYAACKNAEDRKSILALKKKGDEQYQVELVRQKDDEATVVRLESKLELARGTMSLAKRRMDYCVASRLLEAYSNK